MRALVTGGTGFIGSHIVRKLLAEGAAVRCLTRAQANQKNLDGLNVERMVGDLNDNASLRAAVQGCDYLFHVAADYRLWVRDPAVMNRTNIEGSRHLFEAAASAGVKRIVFTSSVAAVGRPSVDGRLGVGNETWDPTPDQLIGNYKRSKFAADRLAREMAAKGFPIVIVNPSTPIGSHDIKPTPTGKMIVDFLNGKMPGYVDTGLNFVAVEDVAAGHWLAAQSGEIGERYILGHRNLSLKDFLGMVAQAAGKPPPRFKIPYPMAYIAGAFSTGWAALTGGEPTIPLDGVRMAHAPMYYEASKAVKEFNLPQTSVEEAVDRAVRWFRDNAYVKN